MNPGLAPLRLLTSPAVFTGLAAAVAAAGWTLLTLIRNGPEGLGNDFYIYWGAARLLASGGDPYNTVALDQLLRTQHLHVTVGQYGYSYPLLFALLLLPLASLPAQAAAAAFAALSLLALGLAVALLASPLSRVCPLWELVLLGLAAGSFIPVRGSLFFGQVNLLLLVPLALSFRQWRPAAWTAIATAVKLYPVVVLGVLAVRGRQAFLSAIAGVAGAAALVLIPNLVLRHTMAADRALQMLGPDTYWTNESINGAVSRLALASDYTAPLLPNLPVLAVTLALDALIGSLVALLVLRRRGEPWSGCVALALGWALLAAPKISLWDLTPLLLASAYCWPQVRRRPLHLLVLAASWSLMAAQSSVDVARQQIYQGFPSHTLLSSLAVAGALLLLSLVAWVVWREPENGGEAGVGSGRPRRGAPTACRNPSSSR